MMRVALTILLVLVAAVGGWYAGTQSKQSINQTDLDGGMTASPASNAGTIHGIGKFEPAAGIINIVAPPGERITNLTDKRIGDSVNLNDVLFHLQSQHLRSKDLELAKARRADVLQKSEFEKSQASFQRDSAILAVKEADASDEEIASQSKNIHLLERQFAAAGLLLERLQKIQTNPTTEDLINQTEIDKQQLMVDQLELQIEQAKLKIILAQNRANRAKQVAQNNLKTIEHAIENAMQATPTQSLDAAVAMAQLAYDMATIKSPIDNATILDIVVPEGGSVTNQPILVLADLTKMSCVVEINDSLLHRIDLEKNPRLRARITSAALTSPLMGTVIQKGIMLGPPSLKDPNPFARVDRRTGTITIELDDHQLAARLVNLQVDVEIEVELGGLSPTP